MNMKLLTKHNLPIYIKKYLKGKIDQKNNFYGSEKDGQIIFAHPDEVAWLPRFSLISLPKDNNGYRPFNDSDISLICQKLIEQYLLK